MFIKLLILSISFSVMSAEEKIVESLDFDGISTLLEIDDLSSMQSIIEEEVTHGACGKLALAPQQKHTIAALFVSFKKNAIDLKAEAKKLKIDYFVALMHKKTTRAEVDAFGEEIINKKTTLARNFVGMVNTVLFDVLANVQRKLMVKCLMMHKKKRRRRGHHGH